MVFILVFLSRSGIEFSLDGLLGGVQIGRFPGSDITSFIAIKMASFFLSNDLSSSVFFCGSLSVQNRFRAGSNRRYRSDVEVGIKIWSLQQLCMCLSCVFCLPF